MHFQLISVLLSISLVGGNMLSIRTISTSFYSSPARHINRAHYPKPFPSSLRLSFITSHDKKPPKTNSIPTTKRYRGVTPLVGKKQFKAKITQGGVVRQLGVFESALEAALAYDKAALSLGRNTLNFPQERSAPVQTSSLKAGEVVAPGLYNDKASPLPNTTWLTPTSIESSAPSISGSDHFDTLNNYDEMEQNHLKKLIKYHGEFWGRRLANLERPPAVNLLCQLTDLNALGYDTSKSPASTVPGQARQGTMLAFILEQKEIHKDKVLLVRVGEFFESYGIDAVMLVEHCGLNPMGGRARAGMPWRNIQAALDDLVAAGHSVAVYEELNLEHSKSAKKRGLKSRFLSQVVNAASPTYLYDTCLRGDDVEFRTSRPYAAVSYAPTSGYSLVVAELDTREFRIYERLTPEALTAKIASETPIEPLYLGLGTVSSDMPWSTAEVASSPFLNDKASPVQNTATTTASGGGVDRSYVFPLSSLLLNKISNDFMLDVSTFRLVNSNLLSVKIDKDGTIHENNQERNSNHSASACSPHPLYVSTAHELGLLDNGASSHVVDLPSRLLPSSSGSAGGGGLAMQRRQLRRWLLSPPPHHVADARSQVLQALSGTTGVKTYHNKENGYKDGENNEVAVDDEVNLSKGSVGMMSLPPLKTQVPLGKLVSMLTVGQANPPLLRDLASMVHSVGLLLGLPALPPLLHIWSHHSAYLPTSSKIESMKQQQGHISDLAQAWLKEVEIKLKSISFDEETETRSNVTARSKDINSLEVEKGGFEVLVEPMLVLTAHESGLPVDRQQLSLACAKILTYITTHVSPPPLPSHQTSTQSSSPLLNNLVSEASESGEDYSNIAIPHEYVKKNEGAWRDTVRPFYSEKLLEHFLQVDVKLKELNDAITNDFPKGLDITYDPINNMLLLRKDPAQLNNVSVNEDAEFYVPRDRNGKLLKGRWSSRRVEACAGEYVSFCQEAEGQVRKALAEISSELSENIPTLVHASHWASTLQTLCQHSIHAQQLHWSLPTLVTIPSPKHSHPCKDDKLAANQINEANESPFLSIEKLVPYWIDGTGRLGEPVANSFAMKPGEMILLTAPNMSGKSTLMRSLLTACLLGNCGLYVPAQHATIPRFESLFLRCAGNDSPVEGKSGWGMEADEIRALLRDAGDKSLVLVDEIARGTSARDGAAISGALLEVLDSIGSTGMFSTHLHELLELPLTYSDRVSKRRMGVKWIPASSSFSNNLEVATGRQQDITIPEWTYQLEEGVCVESLAIHTGRKFGLPEPVLQRAAHLAQQFDLVCRQNQDQNQNQTQRLAPPAFEEIHPHSVDALDSSSSESPDSLRGASSSMGSIKYVKKVMERVLSSKATGIVIDDNSSVSCDVCITHIPSHWDVPPHLNAGQSCLYVLSIPRLVTALDTASTSHGKKLDTIFYVGETDVLKNRIAAHRKRGKVLTSSVNSRRDSDNELLLWSELEVLVCQMPDKSHAREMETLLIKSMANSGINLLSNHDGNHRHFGSK